MINDPVLEREWHVVLRSKDLKDGTIVPARVMGEDLVLWRVDGRALVWRDLCIHRGAKLSLGTIKEECIVCPYHGWEYNSEGKCTRIPAQSPSRAIPSKAQAQPYLTCEKYGVVWVCFSENPITPEPILPIFEGQSMKLYMSAHPIAAKGPRIVENYLDFSHLPFLHAGYLGDPDMPQVEDYKVEMTDEGLVARDLRIWQPNPDGSGVGGYRSYDYFCYRPLIAAFSKEKVLSVLTATPVDEENSIAWLFGMSEFRQDLTEEEATKWSSIIIGQDQPAVESQRPELLPLDLQEELHLACDRLAIAYRRWLKELGLVYGVS